MEASRREELNNLYSLKAAVTDFVRKEQIQEEIDIIEKKFEDEIIAQGIRDERISAIADIKLRLKPPQCPADWPQFMKALFRNFNADVALNYESKIKKGRIKLLRTHLCKRETHVLCVALNIDIHILNVFDEEIECIEPMKEGQIKCIIYYDDKQCEYL